MRTGALAVEAAMFAAVDTCAVEYLAGVVGLDCLTAQSGLFGMREGPGLVGDPSAQE